MYGPPNEDRPRACARASRQRRPSPGAGGLGVGDDDVEAQGLAVDVFGALVEGGGVGGGRAVADVCRLVAGAGESAAEFGGLGFEARDRVALRGARDVLAGIDAHVAPPRSPGAGTAAARARPVGP